MRLRLCGLLLIGWLLVACNQAGLPTPTPATPLPAPSAVPSLVAVRPTATSPAPPPDNGYPAPTVPPATLPPATPPADGYPPPPTVPAYPALSATESPPPPAGEDDAIFLPIVVPPADGCADAATLIQIALAPPGASEQAYSYDVLLRNAGSCPWSADYRLVYLGGLTPVQLAVAPDRPVAPGEDGRFRVAFVPTALGAASTQWQLQDGAGQPVGPPVPIDFVVDADGPHKCGLGPCATATPVQPPAAAQGPTIDELAIVSVNVRADGGRDVTLRWRTTGASGVTLVAGTQQRFPPGFDGPPSGEQTLGLIETYYPNPLLTLVARDDAGHSATQSVTLDWPCRHIWFFAPAGAPVTCAAGAAVSSGAAEQTFENGIMIWLQALDEIYVIAWDGRFWRFPDTWDATQPESDPALVPPPGMQQPIRGFGKVWRENPAVSAALGWPPGVELGYTAQYQRPFGEAPPEQFYVTGFDGRIYKLVGSEAGNWNEVQ